MIPKPARKDVWNFDLDRKVFIEVVHWGVDRENGFESMNDGKGVWNYYCSIPERVMPERFEELWLTDKPMKFSEASPERITHDYMSAPFSNVDWHGGITFYDKVGQVKGHRAVKMGCDYSHLWDMEAGYPFDFDSVANEAMETAKQLKELYNL